MVDQDNRGEATDVLSPYSPPLRQLALTSGAGGTAGRSDYTGGTGTTGGIRGGMLGRRGA